MYQCRFMCVSRLHFYEISSLSLIKSFLFYRRTASITSVMGKKRQNKQQVSSYFQFNLTQCFSLLRVLITRMIAVETLRVFLLLHSRSMQRVVRSTAVSVIMTDILRSFYFGWSSGRYKSRRDEQSSSNRLSTHMIMLFFQLFPWRSSSQTGRLERHHVIIIINYYSIYDHSISCFSSGDGTSYICIFHSCLFQSLRSPSNA